MVPKRDDPPFASLLSQVLEQKMHVSSEGLALTKLQGDASYRIYYRLNLANGQSFIVMKLPEGKASASEEITNLKGKPSELPFLNMAQFLKEKALPVPEIYYHDTSRGILLLEDLGDETLEKRLSRCSWVEKETWYRKAVDLLVLFQKNGFGKGGQKNGCVAHQRSFDETLFHWEFDHFLEYGIEGRLGTTMPPKDREIFLKETRRITQDLMQIPLTLTHRDYQSRNLMITKGGELAIIDFQDALLGPLPYDLVALLRDSYIVLPEEMVSRLIDYYLKMSQRERGESLEPTSFQKMFDRITIQRKLKDAGRFVYIDRVKGNPAFLPFIPVSLTYVREAFERNPELSELHHLLKKYAPEFSEGTLSADKK